MGWSSVLCRIGASHCGAPADVSTLDHLQGNTQRRRPAEAASGVTVGRPSGQRVRASSVQLRWSTLFEASESSERAHAWRVALAQRASCEAAIPADSVAYWTVLLLTLVGPTGFEPVTKRL